jgi:hypothetical protein
MAHLYMIYQLKTVMFHRYVKWPGGKCQESKIGAVIMENAGLNHQKYGWKQQKSGEHVSKIRI